MQLLGQAQGLDLPLGQGQCIGQGPQGLGHRGKVPQRQEQREHHAGGAPQTGSMFHGQPSLSSPAVCRRIVKGILEDKKRPAGFLQRGVATKLEFDQPVQSWISRLYTLHVLPVLFPHNENQLHDIFSQPFLHRAINSS